MLKKRRESPAADVTVFVDRRGEDGPAVVAKPHGIIGASSEERHPERRAADDHRACPCRPVIASHIGILTGLDYRVALDQFTNPTLQGPFRRKPRRQKTLIGYDVVALIRVFADGRFEEHEVGN